MARKKTPEPHQIATVWVPETIEEPIAAAPPTVDETAPPETATEAAPAALPPVIDRSAKVLLQKIEPDEGPSTVAVWPHEIPIYRRLGWRVAGE